MNQQHRLLKAYITFCLMLIPNILSYAQQAVTNIEYSGHKGLYSIYIPQELRALIGNNTSAIRIVNKNGDVSPYIVYKQISNDSDSQFIAIQNVLHVKKDSSSAYILPLDITTLTDEIQVEIANTTVTKSYRIDGSNDTINWYSVTDNTTLSNIYSSNQATIFKTITFPKSNYKFIRIKFNDTQSAPLKVLQWGIVTYKNQRATLEQVRDFTISIQHNSNDKTTLLTINKNKRLPIEIIQFYISNPQFYNRNAEIFIEKTKKLNRKEQIHKDIISVFSLNHTLQNKIKIASILDAQFNILIENEDNLNLKIDSISLWTTPLQIIAQLDAQQNYQLIIDTTLSAPKYDLSEQDILANKSTIGTTKTGGITYPQKADTPTQTSNNWILWVCIGIGVMIMFYFGGKLLKDMNNK